ncbi:MAG: branched-chain amino acid ABC transporter permease [Actinomycetes bacterium]
MEWDRILANSFEAFIGRDAVIYALAAIGLNIHFGYTGLLNFGQAAFLAVAAYGLAITVSISGLSFWLGLVMGVLGAIVLALLLGVPTLRLRADYLAIVTIAASEVVRLVFRAASLRDYTGGSNGLTAFANDFYSLNPYPEGDYGFWLVSFSENELWILTVGWILIIAFSYMVWLLVRSPWGRVLKAIREDEDAVRSLGKNVYFYKMQSLVLGGVLGCFGGFVFAIASQSVQPDLYGPPLTFLAYACLILGGAARVLGPVLGAMIFWMILAFTDNFLNQAVRADYIPDSIMTGTQVGQVRFMLVGLALILLMIYRPQGIFGDRREIALDAR